MITKIFLIIASLFLSASAFCQDTLQHSFPNIITVPKYAEIIYAALDHYPELINTHIIFKEQNLESTAKTTIRTGTLFSKNHRSNIILINNNKSRTGFLLKDLSVDQQVAILGHELAHVCDFSHRSFGKMICWGLHYLNKKKRRDIERDTDLSTIHHGLRDELFSWSSFALSSPLTTPAYKKMRNRFYLHPIEIMNSK